MNKEVKRPLAVNLIIVYIVLQLILSTLFAMIGYGSFIGIGSILLIFGLYYGLWKMQKEWMYVVIFLLGFSSVVEIILMASNTLNYLGMIDIILNIIAMYWLGDHRSMFIAPEKSKSGWTAGKVLAIVFVILIFFVLIIAGVLAYYGIFAPTGFLNNNQTQPYSQVISSFNQTGIYPKSDEIASKTLKYVNENLVETGKTAYLMSIAKFIDLYNVTCSYQGRNVSIFVTKDGNYVFLSAPEIMNETGIVTTTEGITSKSLKFINDNLVQPNTSASFVGVEEFEGLYNLTVSYQGKNISVFVTNDGSNMFLSAPLNMNEKLIIQTNQQSSNIT